MPNAQRVVATGPWRSEATARPAAGREAVKPCFGVPLPLLGASQGGTAARRVKPLGATIGSSSLPKIRRSAQKRSNPLPPGTLALLPAQPRPQNGALNHADADTNASTATGNRRHSVICKQTGQSATVRSSRVVPTSLPGDLSFSCRCLGKGPKNDGASEATAQDAVGAIGRRPGPSRRFGGGAVELAARCTARRHALAGAGCGAGACAYGHRRKQTLPGNPQWSWHRAGHEHGNGAVQGRRANRSGRLRRRPDDQGGRPLGADRPCPFRPRWIRPLPSLHRMRPVSPMPSRICSARPFFPNKATPPSSCSINVLRKLRA